MPSSRPEDVARYTVEQRGGEYVTDVPDLLSLFGRQQFTDSARRDLRQALHDVGVGTDPDLLVAERSDALRLFLLQERAVSGFATGRSQAMWKRMRPRSWKGWTAYGFALLLVIAAIDGSDDSNDPVPAATTVEQESLPNERDGVAEKAARRERAQLRRERAHLRRERAQLRHARAKARRVRAAAKERRREQRLIAEQEEQERLDAEALAAQEEEQATACHPSYDPCLDPNSYDYDCEGGSGDGPDYTGYVTVSGPDDYGLDSDGDGTGCES